MPAQVDLTYAMGLPPEQAIAYFKSLGHEITWDWRAAADAVRAHSFSASKAATLDILKDLRKGLQDSLTAGTTEADFLKQLTPILQSKGWWGTQVAVDSEGNAELTQLGSPARLKTIYRTNMQSAMMAGRWKDFMAVTDSRPYWMYVAVMDERTRPAHAAMNGRVFRYDDPIWETHWPPCGYNCRCRVRALSKTSLDRAGVEVESSAGHLKTVDQDWGFDQRTGEVITRQTQQWTGTGRDGKPVRFAPDPGFGFNPAEGASFDPIGEQPDLLPGDQTPKDDPTPIRMLPGQKTWKDYDQLDLRDIPAADRLQQPEIIKAQASAEAALKVLAETLGVS